MKRIDIKAWKIFSFGTAAIMLAHLIILQFSMAPYSSFAGAAWYQDSNKMFLLVLYGVPIIVVTTLTVLFLVSKNPVAENIFCLVKFCIVLPVDFIVFMFMQLFYHNPTEGQSLLLTVSCIAVAIIDVLIMIFERLKLRM